MADVKRAEDQWKKLLRMAAKREGLDKIMKRMREEYADRPVLGRLVKKISRGALAEVARKMVFEEAELRRRQRDLKLQQNRFDLMQKSFWITFEEETGLAEEHLKFEPRTFTVRKPGPARPKEDPSSLTATVEGWKDLVVKGLRDPIAACHMAGDPCLPGWIRSMAASINTGNLKPGLRKAIERCVDDPKFALRCANGNEGQTLSWFLQLARILGARKKWSLT